MNKNKQAFTLVELIVVITILAILGTIAFISLQGYSKSARDSTRISDMSKIKTSLELFKLNAGKYPESTTPYLVTYRGALARMQGIFGPATYISVEKLDKIPTDPLTGKEYIYSVTNTRQEYEIAGIMEGDDFTSFFNQTNAGETIARLKITGKYNGKILKVSTGSTTYVLAVPSIISTKLSTLEEIVENKTIAYNGYKNLPAQYDGGLYNVAGDEGLNFVNSNDLVVYSGSLETLAETTVEGIDARKDLIINLQKAYSGTTITNIGEIAQIINTSLDDTQGVEFLSSTIVNNDLGGNLIITVGGNSNVSTLPLIDKEKCELLANWIWVEGEYDVYIGSNKGNGFCISPIFGNWWSGASDGKGGISWNGWGNHSIGDYNGWDSSSIDDSLNSGPLYGQTRNLDSETAYDCKPLGTATGSYITEDTLVGRMKRIATTGNLYDNAKVIDWVTLLVPFNVGEYPQVIPALYLADCLDGVKDLGKTMTYKHNDNNEENITYSQYNNDALSDPDTISLSDVTYQNRQKYLTAWTQKSGSHLPSAFSYISDGTPGGCELNVCDNLTGDSRGEYQMACDNGKLGAVTWNGVDQYVGSSDDIEAERIWLSAIGSENGNYWGNRARMVGYGGCGDQSYNYTGNHFLIYSARFIIRP